MESRDRVFDVLVIGAGPSGLACAIEAGKAGLSAVILEKGNVADAIRRFPTNMTWFSTPELLEIGDIPFVIPTVRPTRVDTLNYYQRVAEHWRLDIRPMDAASRVVKREELFLVTTVSGRTYHAKYVVVATGYFDRPNRLGVPGEEKPNVSHYYDEPFKHFGQHVAVIGGSNSAVEAALDLFRHRIRVTLIHRGERISERVKYWVVPDFENRVKKGEIAVRFNSQVKEFCQEGVVIQAPEGVATVHADFTYVLIGFHPDTENLSSYGVRIHPETLVPEHDPASLETNVRGLFLAGSIVAGRDNNQIFVENGRLHAAAIIPAILARTV